MAQVGSFVSELRRRRVFRMAALYIVAAWVILQVADLAFPALGIPDSAIRYVWIGAFLGFPLALIFSWLYEITPDGVIRTPPADPDAAVDLSLKRFDYAMLVALLAVAAVITWQLGTEIQRFEKTERMKSASVAVLPLINFSDDPEQEYFAAGMHDALITVLAKISSLKVIARTSMRKYRDTDMSILEIGEELGVGTLVSGSVYRVGDQVRITVQAVDVQSDEHIWAEEYERELRNVLALQNDVVHDIAQQIRVTLTPEEETRLTRARPVDPETYDLYLKGTYELSKFTREGRERSLELLEEAVARDPDEPLAHAGLALVYALIASHMPSPPPEAWERAKNSAHQALQLDPGLAEAHAAIAEIKLYRDWDWEGAREAFARAVELNSSLAGTHAHYAWNLSLYGDMDVAIERMREAQLVDPMNPLWVAWQANLLMMDDRLDEALAEAQRGLDIDPGNFWPWKYVGDACAAMGRYDEAIDAHKKMVELNPAWMWSLGRTYALAGRTGEARAILAELETRDHRPSPWGMAQFYAALGDKEKGIRELQRMYENHHPWTAWITSPQFAALQDDPRHDEIIEKLNLPVQP